MSKKIIIIGDLSKKTLLPFLSALANIALNMIIYYFPGDRQNIVLDLYSSSFGMLSVTFIPYILINAMINSEKKEMYKLYFISFSLCFLFNHPRNSFKNES